MRADSFKDILTQFLEENPKSRENPTSTESQTTKASAHFHSQPADIPFVFLDNVIRPPRASRTAYGLARQERKLDSPSRKIEVMAPKSILREQLSSTAQKALDSLLRLGAVDLEVNLSEFQLKKAYRRLVKFYHPDHYPLDLSATDRQHRADQFLELQMAMKALHNEVSTLSR